MAFRRAGVLFSFISFGFALLCFAEDAMIFTSVPPSITFNSKDTIPSSKVADIFSAIMSYTLPEPFTWQSLDSPNPMKSPAAICEIDITGVNTDLPLNIPGEKFILENQNDMEPQNAKFASRTEKRFGNKSVILRINADDELFGPKSEYRDIMKTIPAESAGRLEKAKEDPDLARSIQEGTFNLSLPSDTNLLLELVTLKLLNKAVLTNKDAVNDKYPDFYCIVLKALPEFIEEHGADSPQAREGIRLLELICMETKTVFDTVYKNQAVVVVVTETSMPYVLTRKSRSLLQEKPTVKADPTVIVFMGNYSAYNFQDDFHVAFALTAFTSVLLILTVLGVSVGMWFMDPGRDSIIYRMTSQRKKD